MVKKKKSVGLLSLWGSSFLKVSLLTCSPKQRDGNTYHLPRLLACAVTVWDLEITESYQVAQGDSVHCVTDIRVT